MRVRPRWPGRESSNPCAFVVNGSSIEPNPQSRRHLFGSRAASIGAPANPPAYEYPLASPNARAVAVAFERPAPGDQPQ